MALGTSRRTQQAHLSAKSSFDRIIPRVILRIKFVEKIEYRLRSIASEIGDFQLDL